MMKILSQKYIITQVQLDTLLDACKPVPYMIIGGIPPRSPRENVNAAWKKLGDELRFDYLTVQPVSGEPSTVFTAKPFKLGEDSSD